MKTNKSYLFYIFGLLIFLNILAGIVFFNLNKDRFLKVNFFDVGQGDAIFIVTPQKHQILIDGGPSDVILEKLAKKMPFWDRTIDLMILTHPSADHLRGLLPILERYTINQILWTGVEVETAVFEEWVKLIEKEKADIFISQAGQKIKMGEFLYIDILHPAQALEGEKMRGGKAINNTSIVARLTYNENSFLFTGDIEKEVEKELIEREVYLDSDILKVAHQGSRTSSLRDFIEKVSPEIAVISVGRENIYNHPHQEVLDNLKNYGIRILRTDFYGDIKIISNGINYAISNF